MKYHWLPKQGVKSWTAADAAVAQWLADKDRLKVLHDAKGPMHALSACGWTLRGVSTDTALASAWLAMS